tara:strand:- start:58 stop:2403 length:2346 start_codon:yes stop_codon:yes gene_type:complete
MGKSSNNKQIEYQREAADRAYEYDMKVHEHQWGMGMKGPDGQRYGYALSKDKEGANWDADKEEWRYTSRADFIAKNPNLQRRSGTGWEENYGVWQSRVNYHGRNVDKVLDFSQYEDEGLMWQKHQQQLDQRRLDESSTRASREYQDATNLQSWGYQEDLSRQQHQLQLNAFNKSAQTKAAQLAINQRVLATGQDREIAVYDEAIQQQGFEDRRLAQELAEVVGTLGYDQDKLWEAFGISELDAIDKQNQLDARYRQDVALGNLDTRQIQNELDGNLKQLDNQISQSARRLTASTKKAGTDTTATQIQGEQTRSELLTESQRQDLSIKGKERAAGTAIGQAQLDLKNVGGSIGFAKSKASRDFLSRESASRYESAAAGLELQEAKQRSDYERDLLNRELGELKANNAFELTKLQVNSLKQAGEAALSQSGRSQAKAVIGFAAAAGRQQAALVSSVTRAESLTQRKIRESKLGKLNAIQKAAMKEQKISEDRLASLATLTSTLGEADRELGIATERTGLEVGGIQGEVQTAKELASLAQGQILKDLQFQNEKTANNLTAISDQLTDEQYLAQLTQSGLIDRQGIEKSAAQVELDRIMNRTGYAKEMLSYDTDTISRQRTAERLKTTSASNFIQTQKGWTNVTKNLDADIADANRAGALGSRDANIQDLLIQKDVADERAEAMAMLHPGSRVQIPRPESLPVEQWNKILSPEPAPGPILGAKMSYDGVDALDVIGGVGAGALAGVGAYSAMGGAAAGASAGTMATASAVAWPVGVAIALYSIFG